VEKFKRGMNRAIKRKLMEAENQLGSIEQWYRRATALDRNWRESRREEKRLREKKETAGAATEYAMTISVAKEANASPAGNNRACSNRGSRKDEYSSSERVGNGGSKKRLIYNRNRQRKELLCLWRFQAHGPPL